VAQEFLAGRLTAAGFECELLGPVPERPNLVARLRGAGPGPTLCLLGHVDTVLADPAEWSVDPWAGELRDGMVWGRGALDMKGQVASEVAGVEELAGSGWRPAAGELLLVITADEEAGATIGARWLCEEAPEKVRCDMIVNEGAGEALEFEGRRFHTLCVGEKGVFRFNLVTEGTAGHASMPAMGDNALLRMVEVLGRLDGRQPPLDEYPEARATLELLLGEPVADLRGGIERVRAIEPRLADQVEPMLGVTFAPTMAEASRKINVVPSRCTVRVDCRVPPGLGEDHVRRRLAELIGPEDDYRIEFRDDTVGNSSPLEGPLAGALAAFADEWDPGTKLLPYVMPGFTDSHWFRKAFPDCVAYGFFPQRAMTMFETGPLIHAPDERIALADLELASGFYRDLPRRLLG
jgi:acetylornithine deacetylase/succinyl-diaminopimelate desuccinylase-like protein